MMSLAIATSEGEQLCNRQGGLRVCIDGRMGTQESGADLVLVGLARELAKLEDGDEEYVFRVDESGSRWLRPYLNGRCREVAYPPRPPQPRWRRAVRTIPGAGPVLRAMKSVLLPAPKPKPEQSSGEIERLGAEVMHFTHQWAFLTSVPSIYTPYDLQHVHYPNFFSEEEARMREICYRAYSEQASAVVAPTRWGKEDLVRQFGLSADKVYVVPLAPMLTVYAEPTEADLGATKKKCGLPDAFVLYPAQTWIHKNHITLLRALALMRDRKGIRINLVCCGHQNEFFAEIVREMQRLDLNAQVRFLGFVTPVELQSLYRLCRCLVFPSKFEGWGLPLLEAGEAGVPVVCSRVRPLCDVVGPGGLLFDPDDPEELAETLLKVWNDDELRADLGRKGRDRASLFTWEKTARKFRVLYRKVGGRGLSDADAALLSEEPLA